MVNITANNLTAFQISCYATEHTHSHSNWLMMLGGGGTITNDIITLQQA